MTSPAELQRLAVRSSGSRWIRTRPVSDDHPFLPPPPTEPRSTATLLVVEDDDAIRELLAEALGFAGYRILAERTGTTGLASAQDLHPDLVILDVNLPDMDAFAVCERLRADGVHAATRSPSHHLREVWRGSESRIRRASKVGSKGCGSSEEAVANVLAARCSRWVGSESA